MKLVGSSGQFVKHPMFNASGTIITGGTPQLILPERTRCSMFMIQNISDTIMSLEIGSARATATITNGVVTSVAITNAGFGFTVPPVIEFLGGGNTVANPNYLGAGLAGYQTPSNVATAHAVLTSGAISSIVIESGGSNYAHAPYVFISNAENDPFGCAIPSLTSGIALEPNGGSYYVNGTACTTDSFSLFCATTGKAYMLKWMD